MTRVLKSRLRRGGPVTASVTSLNYKYGGASAYPMNDIGHIWICDKDADVSVPPAILDSVPLLDCREWDGLFSVHAINTETELHLTAWCDGTDSGSFNLKRDGKNVVSGKARVVHAPALTEPDGYTFPAGAYFGAGLWTVQCEPEAGIPFLIKIRVSDWNSTD